ncbi:MAG: hypothetical protein QME77_11795 [bacterium]|nr:hypothetical protein [bacterium]
MTDTSASPSSSSASASRQSIAATVLHDLGWRMDGADAVDTGGRRVRLRAADARIVLTVHPDGTLQLSPCDATSGIDVAGAHGARRAVREALADVPASMADPMAAPIAARAPVPVPAAIDAPAMTGSWSSAAATAIAADDRSLASIGLVRPGSYEAGTGRPVTEAGYPVGTVADQQACRARLRTGRLGWESQPYAIDALREVAASIRVEARADVACRPDRLDVADDGGITFPPDGDMPPGKWYLEEQGLRTLLPRCRGMAFDGGVGPMRGADGRALSDQGLFPSAFAFLASLPPDERAWILRRCLARYVGEPLTFRTRHVGVDRRVVPSIYAVVTGGYTPYDADRVCTAVAGALEADSALWGMRGSVVYDGTSTSLRGDITFHHDGDVGAGGRPFAAGDVFQSGFRLRSNDAAAGSVGFGPTAYWNACLNMIILSEAADMGRIPHRVTDMSARCRRLIAGTVVDSTPVFRLFAERWHCLRESSVVGLPGPKEAGKKGSTATADPIQSPLDYLGRIVAPLLADVPGSGGEDIVRAGLVAASRREDAAGLSNGSAADVLAAITRWAHESVLLSDIARDVAERRAGELVPVLVSQVQAMA